MYKVCTQIRRKLTERSLAQYIQYKAMISCLQILVIEIVEIYGQALLALSLGTQDG
jgi:hypothetical protein